MKQELYILHCSYCGAKPKMTTDRPQGRLQDVYRIACTCGQGSTLWSVSAAAAIRRWNRFAISEANEKFSRRYMRPAQTLEKVHLGLENGIISGIVAPMPINGAL
ncbi:MAG: hypothetical protein FWH34_01735 [Desulfovibrionaceae bacterium]|nr:hypothetical protein [Desulfovibrionaceae bacterium]